MVIVLIVICWWKCSFEPTGNISYTGGIGLKPVSSLSDVWSFKRGRHRSLLVDPPEDILPTHFTIEGDLDDRLTSNAWTRDIIFSVVRSVSNFLPSFSVNSQCKPWMTGVSHNGTEHSSKRQGRATGRWHWSWTLPWRQTRFSFDFAKSPWGAFLGELRGASFTCKKLLDTANSARKTYRRPFPSTVLRLIRCFLRHFCLIWKKLRNRHGR